MEVDEAFKWSISLFDQGLAWEVANHGKCQGVTIGWQESVELVFGGSRA